MDDLLLFRTCSVDASYLLRYETYTRHLRGIYEASCLQVSFSCQSSVIYIAEYLQLITVGQVTDAKLS
jgi:hypothetical protein